jgi:hypothetical protein
MRNETLFFEGFAEQGSYVMLAFDNAGAGFHPSLAERRFRDLVVLLGCVGHTRVLAGGTPT